MILIIRVFFSIFFLNSLLLAQVEDFDFVIARVHYSGGGDWYSDPTSLPNLLRFVANEFHIKTPKKEKVIRLTSPELYKYPFIYITGHGNIRFSQQEVNILRDYLIGGGFLWADDNYGMDKYFRREIKKIFPEAKLIELNNKHKIFNCYYKLKGLPKIHKHDGKKPQALAVFYKKRMVILYTYESDIGDGLEDKQVHNDPDYKRELARKMALNIVYYFLLYN
jgi:hypothetical protein